MPPQWVEDRFLQGSSIFLAIPVAVCAMMVADQAWGCSSASIAVTAQMILQPPTSAGLQIRPLRMKAAALA